MKQKALAVILVLSLLSLNACANRALLKDDAGRPISMDEVNARKGNSNLILFAIGGGALSFGASFFIGSLVDRSANDPKHTALWVTTGIGTAAGLAYFIHQGRVRDFNLAVEEIRRERLQGLSKKLDEEKRRREQIEAEKRRLLMERQRQEEERRKLLEALKKRKQKEKDQ